jgi:stage III sporulation protein AD
MEIVKICAVGIITAFSVLILRDSKSEAAVLVGVAGGCIVLLMVLDYVADIFAVIKDISEKAGIPSQIWTLILKIVGVGYIAEFSAGIIEEAGGKALADKVILAGKVLIAVLSLPMIVSLFELIGGMLT